MLEKYFTSRQACGYLGFRKLETLYGHIRDGKLRAYKIGGNGKSRRHWRIKESDLKAFIESGFSKQAGAKQAHAEANPE